jgi:hypothetical protein
MRLHCRVSLILMFRRISMVRTFEQGVRAARYAPLRNALRMQAQTPLQGNKAKIVLRKSYLKMMLIAPHFYR